MSYFVTFKLDSRKDVYKSKRVRSGEEPYFPISALIKLVDGNNWKSPVCVTPEAQVPLTLESKFRMTPIKS